MAKTKTKPVEVQAPKWEIKDKLYELNIRETPVVYKIKTRGILWFDKEKGYEREIKYCANQKTIFVDEMKGDQRLDHISFRDGKLFVPKEKQTLQIFLAHHPDNGNKVKSRT